MVEIPFPASSQVSADQPTDSTLTALRLSEERAAAAYRAAYLPMKALAGEFESFRRLAAAFPTRVDYRAAAHAAQDRHAAAVARTDLAYEVYQRAQHATDTHWTATTGRVTAGRTATVRLHAYRAA